MSDYWQCLYAFVGCVGFCIIFNIRGWEMLFAPLGGALGWFVYLLCRHLGNDIFIFFLATIAITVYAEAMARLRKTPVTGYLLVALLPLVPGGGIYYTMEYCINGDTKNFVQTGLHTFGVAGALAVGVLLVSSVVRLWTTVHHSMKSKRSGHNGSAGAA